MAVVAGPEGRCGNREAISKEFVGDRRVCGAIVHNSVTFHGPAVQNAATVNPFED